MSKRAGQLPPRRAGWYGWSSALSGSARVAAARCPSMRGFLLRPLVAAIVAAAGPTAAPVLAQAGLNTIEGRLIANGQQLNNVRVRLTYVEGMRPVGDTITRPGGEFSFARLMPGN